MKANHDRNTVESEMKIKILNWNLNHLGGIVTWVINIREGLRELGHDVRIIHTSEQLRMKTYDHDYTKKESIILACEFISLQEMNKLCDELNSSDLVIIAHPSPHPTKAQLNRIGDGRLWQQVYHNLEAKKVVIFHDNNWETTNSWLQEVSQHIDCICCGQALFVESALRLPGNKKVSWLYHPAKIPDQPCIKKREPICVSGAQWIRWKRYKELLTVLPNLPMKIYFYNIGITYFNLRYTNIFWNYVTDHYDNKKAKIEEKAIFHGNVPHEIFYAALQNSLCSVDFSRRGYVNYTHWEPLIYGAVSLVHEDTLYNKRCKLPKIDLVKLFNDETLDDAMSELLREDESKLNRARIEAWEFCRDNLNRKTVAAELLNFVFTNPKIRG